ncbi:MAG: chemotaxis protein [Deltaproteobacteria bacterium]|jgi:two-component system chemotaxis response regulator CheV|nr:chemotaxis protein [Deltaproteobacteria bacterium]
MSEHNLLLDAASNELEVIEFYLTEIMEDGTEYSSYYGMNVAKVLEIIRLPETITSVPGNHHPAALGTFNLRDRVLPLVDLGLWLGKKQKEQTDRKVIVSEFSDVVTAFIVSGVTNIHRISWAQVEPPGKYLQALSHSSITGVVRFGERIVFLLDMEMIIASMNPSLSMESQIKSLTQEKTTTGAGYKVLVADDSSSIRKVLVHVLEQGGYQVTAVASGSEAWGMLEKWKATAKNENKGIKDYLDIVVSDIEMPEMDGHTLTKKIKGDPELRGIPVVLFSSLISDVVRQQGLKAGADDQVSKPDLPGLSLRIKKLIDGGGAAQE